jgi:hypothetical protein
MSNESANQTTDKINTGFGTSDLSPNQGSPLISGSLVGTTSNGGAKAPTGPQG